LLILRFDGLLFFANAPNFREKVRSLAAGGSAIRMVLVDFESVSDIDTTALDMLEKLHGELANLSIDLHFSRMNKRVHELFQKSGLEKIVGEDHFHISVREGVDAYLAQYGKRP